MRASLYLFLLIRLICSCWFAVFILVHFSLMCSFYLTIFNLCFCISLWVSLLSQNVVCFHLKLSSWMAFYLVRWTSTRSASKEIVLNVYIYVYIISEWACCSKFFYYICVVFECKMLSHHLNDFIEVFGDLA